MPSVKTEHYTQKNTIAQFQRSSLPRDPLSAGGISWPWPESPQVSMASRPQVSRRPVSCSKCDLVGIQILCSLRKEICKESDVMLSCVQVDEIESQPGATGMIHGRKPGLSCCDDMTCQFYLKLIKLVSLHVCWLPTYASNGKPPLGQNCETTFSK